MKQKHIKSDPGSHAYKITPRSKIMLNTYGSIYIYMIYGMYHCMNITTNKGEPGAVLIRAIEPLGGIKDSSGPGKLCKFLDITKKLNNTEVNDKIKIYNYKNVKENNIVKSRRIGINKGKELKWRFYIKNNNFISKT